MVGVDGDGDSFGDWFRWVSRGVRRGHSHHRVATHRDGDSGEKFVGVRSAAAHGLPDSARDLFRAADALALLAADAGDVCTGDLWVLFVGANALSAAVEPRGTAFDEPAAPHIPFASQPVAVHGKSAQDRLRGRVVHDRGAGSPPRVKAFVDVAEAVAGDVGIDFGCADVGVAKEFLNDAQVGAVFEEVSGEAVAQHMRGDIAGDASASNTFFDVEPQCHRRERRAALSEKDGPRRAFRHKFGTPGFKVALKGCNGFASEGHNAFLVALADDEDEAGIELELFEADVAKLGEAQT